MREQIKIENVAVSTRVRLARNVAGFPFPNRLTDEKKAREIVLVVSDALKRTEVFRLYTMNRIPQETAAYLKERRLISQKLIDCRRISAALVSKDESISVMLHEEDHIREQYFTEGLDLKKAYERISGIDDIISENVSFAYDETLGYLTACPTNLGTGLRASVMLFLPAMTRCRRLRELIPLLNRQRLTVRGEYGEGSGTEGELYQISNEVTLGWSEEEILRVVEEEVTRIVELELLERERMMEEQRNELTDTVLRSYGILVNCFRIDAREFMRRMADVKFGVALGLLNGSMKELDALIVKMKPANLNRWYNKLYGEQLTAEECDVYRAEYAGQALREMELFSGERLTKRLL